MALRYGVYNEMDPDQLIKIIDTATTKLRELSRDLHPSDLEIHGLPTTLDRLAKRQAAESNIQIDINLPDKVCLSKEVARVFYRIAQEALNNVRHHSGARHAWLRLKESGDIITLVRSATTGKGSTLRQSSVGLWRQVTSDSRPCMS